MNRLAALALALAALASSAAAEPTRVVVRAHSLDAKFIGTSMGVPGPPVLVTEEIHARAPPIICRMGSAKAVVSSALACSCSPAMVKKYGPWLDAINKDQLPMLATVRRCLAAHPPTCPSPALTAPPTLALCTIALTSTG